MKDENGLYYYPYPADIKSRVYVREGADGPEFRLWHRDYPEVWEKHGWLTVSTLQAAAALYKSNGKNTNPLLLYDIAVAQALLKEEQRQP